MAGCCQPWSGLCHFRVDQFVCCGFGLGGGCCITGVARYDASAATIARGTAFPPSLQGATFFSDLCGKWIGYEGNGLAPAQLAGGLGTPIALSLNELDGALYVVADPSSTQGSIWTIRALLPPAGSSAEAPSATAPHSVFSSKSLALK